MKIYTTDFTEQWLQLMERNELPQGKLALSQVLPNGETAYCCLGLAAKLYEDTYNVRFPRTKDGRYSTMDGSTSAMDYLYGPFKVVADALNLRDGAGTALAPGLRRAPHLFQLNDIHHKTFPEIAAIVRANPEYYFKELK